jgi:Leucine-rich repeat (LRR) protein
MESLPSPLFIAVSLSARRPTRLSKPTNGGVTLAEAATLTDLNLDIPWQSPADLQIKDVSALKHFVNLNTLNIFNCQAADYSPLKNFAHLRVLSAENSTMSDLSVLAGLTGLEILGLKKTKVTDVTPLAGLKKLTRLDFSENAITDFSPLKEIYPNLTEKDFELK